jgi:hypothetical protein
MKSLQKEGFAPIRVDSGLVLNLSGVDVVIGKDPDHESLMVSITDYRGEETESLSFDKMQQIDVVALCEQYKLAQPMASSEGAAQSIAAA